MFLLRLSVCASAMHVEPHEEQFTRTPFSKSRIICHLTVERTEFFWHRFLRQLLLQNGYSRHSLGFEAVQSLPFMSSLRRHEADDVAWSRTVP